MFVLLLVVWGWALLFLLAAFVLLTYPRRGGVLFAVPLILLALPWMWAMRSATFGIRHAPEISPGGNQAWFEHHGFWTYSIFVQKDGRKLSLRYLSGQDQPAIRRVRWISDDLLAIDRAGTADLVYDIRIFEYVCWEGNPSRPRPEKPDFDPAEHAPWQRDPLPAEATFFTDE